MRVRVIVLEGERGQKSSKSEAGDEGGVTKGDGEKGIGGW